MPVITKLERRPAEIRASLDSAIAAAREHDAEEFLVALRWGSQDLLETIRAHLRESPLQARLLPDRNIRTPHGQSGSFPGELVAPVTIQRAALTAFERSVKRALDIVLSSAALMILSPLLNNCRDRHQVR